MGVHRMPMNRIVASVFVAGVIGLASSAASADIGRPSVGLAGGDGEVSDFSVSDAPGCQQCEGGVTFLELQWRDDEAAQIRVEQKDGQVVYDESVAPGAKFVFTGRADRGTFGESIKIYVDGDGDTLIHTHCSQPIGPGTEFGRFLVISGTSADGGPLCSPDAGDPGPGPGGDDGDDCGQCDGEASSLILRYHGGSAAAVRVIQKKDAVTVFDAVVEPGGIFTFEGDVKAGTLGAEIRIYVKDRPNAAIDTSCSQPIGPGLLAGDFEIVGGTSSNGGRLCSLSVPSCVPYTDADTDGVDACEDACEQDPGKTEPGVCGCGVADTDSDGDGAADCVDWCPADVGKTKPGLCAAPAIRRRPSRAFVVAASGTTIATATVWSTASTRAPTT